jgi:hypothetical protein
LGYASLALVPAPPAFTQREDLSEPSISMLCSEESFSHRRVHGLKTVDVGVDVRL